MYSFLLIYISIVINDIQSYNINVNTNRKYIFGDILEPLCDVNTTEMILNHTVIIKLFHDWQRQSTNQLIALSSTDINDIRKAMPCFPGPTLSIQSSDDILSSFPNCEYFVNISQSVFGETEELFDQIGNRVVEPDESLNVLMKSLEYRMRNLIDYLPNGQTKDKAKMMLNDLNMKKNISNISSIIPSNIDPIQLLMCFDMKQLKEIITRVDKERTIGEVICNQLMICKYEDIQSNECLGTYNITKEQYEYVVNMGIEELMKNTKMMEMVKDRGSMVGMMFDMIMKDKRTEKTDMTTEVYDKENTTDMGDKEENIRKYQQERRSQTRRNDEIRNILMRNGEEMDDGDGDEEEIDRRRGRKEYEISNDTISDEDNQQSSDKMIYCEYLKKTTKKKECDEMKKNGNDVRKEKMRKMEKNDKLSYDNESQWRSILNGTNDTIEGIITGEGGGGGVNSDNISITDDIINSIINNSTDESSKYEILQLLKNPRIIELIRKWMETNNKDVSGSTTTDIISTIRDNPSIILKYIRNFKGDGKKETKGIIDTVKTLFDDKRNGSANISTLMDKSLAKEGSADLEKQLNISDITPEQMDSSELVNADQSQISNILENIKNNEAGSAVLQAISNNPSVAASILGKLTWEVQEVAS